MGSIFRGGRREQGAQTSSCCIIFLIRPVGKHVSRGRFGGITTTHNTHARDRPSAQHTRFPLHLSSVHTGFPRPSVLSPSLTGHTAPSPEDSLSFVKALALSYIRASYSFSNHSAFLVL